MSDDQERPAFFASKSSAFLTFFAPGIYGVLNGGPAEFRFSDDSVLIVTNDARI